MSKHASIGYVLFSVPFVPVKEFHEVICFDGALYSSGLHNPGEHALPVEDGLSILDFRAQIAGYRCGKLGCAPTQAETRAVIRADRFSPVC